MNKYEKFNRAGKLWSLDGQSSPPFGGIGRGCKSELPMIKGPVIQSIQSANPLNRLNEIPITKKINISFVRMRRS